MVSDLLWVPLVWRLHHALWSGKASRWHTGIPAVCPLSPPSRGEYFSFYPKLFPDGRFSPLNSSLKMARNFRQFIHITVYFYSFIRHSQVLKPARKGFPAWKTLLWEGKERLPGREEFLTMEGFPCQGRVSLLILLTKSYLLGKGKVLFQGKILAW